MEVLKDSYRFKLGDFECVVISDRTSKVPDTQPKQSSSKYDIQPGQNDIMCLFIRTEEHVVLIDTGLGVGVETNAGKLIQNLQAEGIDCKEIDTVILSHGHGDHIGGNTDAQGRPVFPNARYIMHKEEWEFWTSDPDLTQVNLPKSIKQTFLIAARKNLIPIRYQFKLIDDETEIIPGIELIRAPGHTPSNIVLVISSGAEQLFYVGDLFHQPSELAQPGFYLANDMLPEQARRTKAQILSQVVAPNALVFACHFPFPGLGYIVKKGNVWLWQPLKIKAQ